MVGEGACGASRGAGGARPLSAEELRSQGGRSFIGTVFTHAAITHDVFVGGARPTVFLVHELGGLNATTLNVVDACAQPALPGGSAGDR